MTDQKKPFELEMDTQSFEVVHHYLKRHVGGGQRRQWGSSSAPLLKEYPLVRFRQVLCHRHHVIHVNSGSAAQKNHGRARASSSVVKFNAVSMERAVGCTRRYRNKEGDAPEQEKYVVRTQAMHIRAPGQRVVHKKQRKIPQPLRCAETQLWRGQPASSRDDYTRMIKVPPPLLHHREA